MYNAKKMEGFDNNYYNASLFVHRRFTIIDK